MRCQQTGILRDFPLNSRLRYAAYSLGVDVDIGRCQRVYYGDISGQAAAALPWH